MTTPIDVHRLCRSALCTLLLAAATIAVAAAPAAPSAQVDLKTVAPASDSIYQLSISLTNQDGRTGLLAERRGHPMLISMFYTSCQFVCPMIVDALRASESTSSAEQRAQLPVLMVSFDPAHDSVAVLKQKANERQLDAAHWTLARTDAASARKLAAVLGIQYRALSNGDFNHTTALILVDADGRILGRTTRLGDADPAFVKLIKATIASSAG